jgi:hypothetical protein
MGIARKLFTWPFVVGRIEKKIDDLLILTANQTLQNRDYTKAIRSLEEVEYKVYSQWGDDGIIQYLISKLGIRQKKFIEFGVENYRESNTRFLLVNNNWSGLIFDASTRNIRQIQRDEIYWKYDLTAQSALVTRENINDLIQTNNFSGHIGLLHIDIDGNDYWIWDVIENVDADLIIMEYNAYFGCERPVSVPYNRDFDVSKAHFSHIYFGASLPAFIYLAQKKGYYFIGCNSAGNNAYFVNNRFTGIMPSITAREGFVMIKSRQARDIQGKLVYAGGEKAGALLKGLPVTNVITESIEFL